MTTIVDATGREAQAFRIADMRRTAAILAARTAAGLSRAFRRGGGTALPGLIAERIDPGLVPGLARLLGRGSVIVTGTNGKTTTSRLVRNVAEAAGLRTVANREGSNMMRGVAAALAESASWTGRMPDRNNRIGVFEVDEATVPLVARAVRPRAVAFTNLFRDQLDRYGEVETVAALWRKAAAEFPEDVALVINADDPAVASLHDSARGPVLLYGLEDISVATESVEHAADARWCPACGAELEYSAVFYGHIGHWRCPACGNQRPAPHVACTRVTSDGASTEVEIRTPSGVIAVRLPLAGVYNAYNALAAAATGVALELEDGVIEKGLASFTAAFGRQERFQVDGREVHVILAKNPAGLNQVLRVISETASPLNLAIFLNDDIADGRDISWIWDVDFERLAGRIGSLTVSGRRAWDMALRLKYAGLAERPDVEHNAALALREAIRRAPPGGRVYAIPTYTAMLAVRNVLGRWAGKGAFWEGDGR
jgi:UDP-N-acetylmuramyl tripeptide synthase